MRETRLDLKGLKCPLPALKLRKALRRLSPGDEILVECTDPMSAIDVPHLLNETGDGLLGQNRQDGVLSFHVRKA